MKRNQRARVRKKERKKERKRERKKEIAFFYPFEYYYSVVFSSQSVFFCRLLLFIKIKCKKKAPKKSSQKKAKRHTFAHPNGRRKTPAQKSPRPNVLRRPKAGSSGRNGLLPSEVSFTARVAIERRQTARPVSRDFSAFVSAFGWMDRF